VTEPFESQIAAMQKRLAHLAVQLDRADTDAEQVGKEALADLATALEELFVAGEELTTQTEAIIGGQVKTEMERRYFESLFDQGPAACLITDAAGQVTSANQPAARLIGRHRSFLTGKPLSVFLSPDSQPTMFRMLDRARLVWQAAPRGDLVLCSRSGRETPITAVVTQAPGPDALGETEYRWLLDPGIAGRPFESLTPAEREVAVAALRLDSIVEAASDAIVATDHTQRIILCNRAARDLFGWTSAELLGQPLALLLPSSGDDHDPVAGDRVVRGFADEPAPSRHIAFTPGMLATRKSGEQFPAEVTVSEVRVDDRWVFTTMIRDVTDRERARREQHFAEELNRRVIATLDALVVVLDPQGHILVFNEACERATGFSFDDLAGRPLSEALLPAETSYRIEDIFAELIAEHETKVENEWLTASGDLLRIRWSNTVLTDDAGEVTHLIGTGLDVTHEYELERQMVVTTRLEALGQLAGAVAHDFNNLLSIMQGHLELLGDTDGLPGPAADRVDKIGAALARGKALVANLTALGRHERAGEPAVALNEATVALDRMLADMLGPQITLGLDLAAEPDRVPVDATGIEQVLLNLVLNACDAMPDGGRVTIATRSAAADDTPGVLLTVTDTGVGMDRATRERIFDPFFTTKGPGSGTGLGLASTRMIVEAVGGSVTAESGLGAGTTVSVWLPCAPTAPRSPAVRGPAPEPPRPEPTGRTILVVDDEADLLEVVRDMLVGRDHRILSASGAAAALAVAGGCDGGIDLLLTDIVMPGRSGIELAEDLAVRYPSLAVVFMTAHLDPASAISVGGATPTLLSKPFTRVELHRVVDAALAR
jgi:PAS domain S-box-containing protein